MNIVVENVLFSRIIPDDVKSSGLALVLVFIPDIPHTTIAMIIFTNQPSPIFFF